MYLSTLGSDPFSYKECLPSPPWASLRCAAELSIFSLESMNFCHSSCHLLYHYTYFTSSFLCAFSTLPAFIYSSFSGLWGSAVPVRELSERLLGMFELLGKETVQSKPLGSLL